jgi:hypothetical protein
MPGVAALTGPDHLSGNVKVTGEGLKNQRILQKLSARVSDL